RLLGRRSKNASFQFLHFGQGLFGVGKGVFATAFTTQEYRLFFHDNLDRSSHETKAAVFLEWAIFLRQGVLPVFFSEFGQGSIHLGFRVFRRGGTHIGCGPSAGGAAASSEIDRTGGRIESRFGIEEE